MKYLKRILIALCAFYFVTTLQSFSQELTVYQFIGKTKSDVIKQYGKPIHSDESNPDMVCIFYKKNQDTMIFVSDKTSVYQVDAMKFYPTEAAALTALNSAVQTAISQSFSPDTLSSSSFKLYKPGVEFNISVNKASSGTDYQVKLHAAHKE
ncbi:MAG: hypothetical protein C4543_04950 [Ignavibacteriales bacterium]|jgi:hypothetical protein|nr:MAG: hypothetical protein C4543_04950 [Ignavibacteriales bacterium]